MGVFKMFLGWPEKLTSMHHLNTEWIALKYTNVSNPSQIFNGLLVKYKTKQQDFYARNSGEK